jgi:hypothetical protein
VVQSTGAEAVGESVEGDSEVVDPFDSVADSGVADLFDGVADPGAADLGVVDPFDAVADLFDGVVAVESPSCWAGVEEDCPAADC